MVNSVRRMEGDGSNPWLCTWEINQESSSAIRIWFDMTIRMQFGDTHAIAYCNMSGVRDTWVEKTALDHRERSHCSRALSHLACAVATLRARYCVR